MWGFEDCSGKSTWYRYDERQHLIAVTDALNREVRKWMLDPKNYELAHFSYNRSAGARLNQLYRSPDNIIGPHEKLSY
ncbi:hypothetical protein [Pseudomonas asiatica]|uniref:RHS repeat protein n=1 Tax=Pseudomonas asiatica TaxID=2219225 RepID=A0ABU5L5M0_9PSED|nr:hypothetical protein [Pseudomonas asiatica]MDZ5741370.1 hypothetical protein [Pseudomonas asiatica]MDZ5746507.1 hypothetical protein [Pseudomonas asiatica]MDZ5751553.1 hypothetical protein [Pseudomonas asiatica]MDZ5756718.1 hypothetical protein [Pseudomonas asiatica]